VDCRTTRARCPPRARTSVMNTNHAFGTVPAVNIVLCLCPLVLDIAPDSFQEPCIRVQHSRGAASCFWRPGAARQSSRTDARRLYQRFTRKFVPGPSGMPSGRRSPGDVLAARARMRLGGSRCCATRGRYRRVLTKSSRPFDGFGSCALHGAYSRTSMASVQRKRYQSRVLPDTLRDALPRTTIFVYCLVRER
jgi:hypothetical protein